ncbi:MAG TPA: ATP-binding cassette domain-containing protein, partial [Conexibacter sp.]|nr:ATP-binding cassette domain-containing protein [Conexibacter sp.]
MTDPDVRADHDAIEEAVTPGANGLSQRIVAEQHAERQAGADKVFEIEDVAVAYSGQPAVKNVSFPIYKHDITALIGPSGCGKSTLLRCLNRMNDLIPGAAVSGSLRYHGQDLYG